MVRFLKKYFARPILTLIICAVIGTVLILAAYALPTKRIQYHVSTWSNWMSVEGGTPRWAGEHMWGVIDNYTDAIMLNMAEYDSENQSLTEKAMMNYWITFLPAENDSVNALTRIAAGEGVQGKAYSYGRYWQGELVPLKIFLQFCGVGDIRTFNMVAQGLLLFAVLYYIRKLLGMRYTLAFFVAVLAMDPISMALSLQMADLYYIILLTLLWLLTRQETGTDSQAEISVAAGAGSASHGKLQTGRKGHRPDLAELLPVVFVAVGAATSYFDFLTYPVATLGIPLIFVIALGIEKNWFRLLGSCIEWAFGYFGMWASKWILAYVFTGKKDVLEDGLRSTKIRTGAVTSGEGGVEGHISFGYAAGVNVKALLDNGMFRALAIALVIFLAAMLLGRRLQKRQGHIAWARIGLYCCTAVLPFAWYCVVRNHAGIHPWLEYRSLWITVLAVFFSICELLQYRRKQGTSA